MQPFTPRKLAAFALASAIGVTALPLGANAAWKGLRSFDCATSRSNWNFDGLCGPYTTRAVRNFQKAHHLKVNGIAGPETYAALGLKYRRTISCGMGGNDVFLLQQTLAAAGYWYGGDGNGEPSAAPSKKPSTKPAFTAPPVIMTPEPSESPAVISTPEPEASLAPTATPMMATPTPEPVWTPVENRPTLELKGGDWMVPLNAGSTNYDYTFMRPTWTGEADLWLGDLGLQASATAFNTTYTTYRTAAYFAQNTLMYDGLLKYRFDHGYYNVFAGYRGIGLGDVNFGTVGVALDRPLFGDWLWLQAKAQGGHNFQSSYFLDGQAGLGLRISLLELELGFRHMAFQNGAVDPLFNMNGPVANVKLQF